MPQGAFTVVGVLGMYVFFGAIKGYPRSYGGLYWDYRRV